MNRLLASHLIATATLLVVVLTLASRVFGQSSVRKDTPVAAFSLEAGHARTVDTPGGRSFRAGQGETINVRGVLQMPPSSAALPKLQKLVIKFRTISTSGLGPPHLKSVELRNGSSREFQVDNDLEGDWSSREVDSPPASPSGANAWIFRNPIKVNPQTAIRLVVYFSSAIDINTSLNPGEFVLTGVEGYFERKPIEIPKSTTLDLSPPISISGLSGPPKSPGPGKPATPPVGPVPANQVIYALASNNELLWFAHSGRDDGSFKWAAPAGREVGSGWAFRQLFSGDNGVIYAITSNGDLLWYRHDGHLDGTYRWAASEGKKIGTGWNYERVFYAGGGVIYAITESGNLLWFRHNGRDDGTDSWADRDGKVVGSGWNVSHVFPGDDGVIYTVSANGDLVWHRHDGRDDGTPRWANNHGTKIGSGWNYKEVFSAGGGVIYAINASGELLWFRHDGRHDGTDTWAARDGRKVGSGWVFNDVFSGANLEP